jgi:hypothetical protein
MLTDAEVATDMPLLGYSISEIPRIKLKFQEISIF